MHTLAVIFSAHKKKMLKVLLWEFSRKCEHSTEVTEAELPPVFRIRHLGLTRFSATAFASLAEITSRWPQLSSLDLTGAPNDLPQATLPS